MFARPFHACASILWTLLGANVLFACVEAPAAIDWPDVSGVGTRLVVQLDPSGAVQLYRADLAPPSGLNLGRGSELFLLDYECAEPELMGLRFIGDRGVEVPSGPLRSPDQAFHLKNSQGTARFEALPLDAGAADLGLLPFEFRFPSSCQVFESLPTPTILEAEQLARFVVDLGDGTALLFSEVQASPGQTVVHHFRSAAKFDEYRLAPGLRVSAAAADANGLLWLFSGPQGRLWRGRVRDIGALEELFEVLPSAPPDHECTGDGDRDDSYLALQTTTGTASELMLVNGSGTLRHLRRGRWSTLLDPVGSGQVDLLCRLGAVDILWLGPGRALVINPAIEQGRWPLVRVEFDSSGEASFHDDRISPDIDGLETLLDLGERGPLVGGRRGRIARRGAEGWTTLEPGSVLARNIDFMFEGPRGAVMLGNGAEGLAQYYPDEPGRPLACRTRSAAAPVRAAALLGADEIVALPTNEPGWREVQAWRLRPPTACELPPD